MEAYRSLRGPYVSLPVLTPLVSRQTSSPPAACKNGCYLASPVPLSAKARHVNRRFQCFQGALLNSKHKLVLTLGGRRNILYEDTNTYVLIEPGQDEMFVSIEELKFRLIKWLENWPEELPSDLSRYDSLEEAASYLVTSVCELDLGGGLGSIQWFEVVAD